MFGKLGWKSYLTAGIVAAGAVGSYFGWFPPDLAQKLLVLFGLG